jgi:hypothetical protein
MSGIVGSSDSLGRNTNSRKFQQLRENHYNLEFELWANDNLQSDFLVVRWSVGVDLLTSKCHHSVDRVQTLREALERRRDNKNKYARTNFQQQQARETQGFIPRFNSPLRLVVAESPKLYSPHAPVIVSTTSDSYTCVPHNLKVCRASSENSNHPQFYNSHRINKGVTITLQHLLQNFTSECRRITTIDLQIMIKLTFYKFNLNDGSRVER